MSEEYLKGEELDIIFEQDYKSNFEPNLEDLQQSHRLTVGDKFNGHLIINKQLENAAFIAQRVQGVKFYNCKFTNCDFTGSYFWMSIFQNCEFEKCNLNGTALSKCDIIDTIFSLCESKYQFTIEESELSGSTFDGCFFDGFRLAGVDTFGVQFKACGIEHALFQGNVTFRAFLALLSKDRITKKDEKYLKSKKSYGDLIFDNCIISFSNFRSINFIDTVFKKCGVFRCAFIDSKLYDYNFYSTFKRDITGDNHLDLNTISQSENISSETLIKVFNISQSFQAEIKLLMKDKVLQSVFISYSLKDNQIANKINSALKSRGVTTFLWEQDALGGRTLKDIMKSNIDSKDRLLFIASENSLKSEACHFELSEGRRKREKIWDTILFPVHIDNFLFKVEKDQIRPKSKQEEYWENIQELREVNSLDFSTVNRGENSSDQGFNNLIDKLVESLKA